MSLAAPARSYDLLVRASGSSLFHLDRGLALADDQLAWSSTGVPTRAKLASITAIRLQTGGSWQRPIGLCEIRFDDDSALTINSGAPFGTDVRAQTALYREFVHDLHRRLTALGLQQVQFRSGYSERKFQTMVVLTLVAGLTFVALPMVLFALFRDLRALGLFIFSVAFTWPLVTMVGNNAAQPYDPERLPDNVLP
jgi:hypothetical protein